MGGDPSFGSFDGVGGQDRRGAQAVPFPTTREYRRR
jgi:hypothetical protein